MEAKDKRVIQEEILGRFPGTDPEIDIDWETAEISFKAGEEKARREATIAMNELVNKVSKKQFKAGIRGVGEWMNDTDMMIMLSPRKRREWQAKLKEWEVE